MKTKREERRKNTAEFFTPDWLTDQMLDKLEEYGNEAFEANKTWLDPSCGNGNMLTCVLRRLILKGHDPKDALKWIYGVDIMEDNILECRQRLLDIAGDTPENRLVVEKQIKWLDTKIYPKGSLDYDFSFEDVEQDKFKWIKGD